MPKSKEGGKVFNSKTINIFLNCINMLSPKTRLKTYCMIKRLINK